MGNRLLYRCRFTIITNKIESKKKRIQNQFLLKNDKVNMNSVCIKLFETNNENIIKKNRRRFFVYLILTQFKTFLFFFCCLLLGFVNILFIKGKK